MSRRFLSVVVTAQFTANLNKKIKENKRNQLCLTKATLDSLTTNKPVALGFQIELEFGKFFFFVEGRKPENPEENPWSKDKNQQQTQPTYDVKSGNRTRATLVGGKCSHHGAISAPPESVQCVDATCSLM